MQSYLENSHGVEYARIPLGQCKALAGIANISGYLGKLIEAHLPEPVGWLQVHQLLAGRYSKEEEYHQLVYEIFLELTGHCNESKARSVWPRRAPDTRDLLR